MSVRRPTDGDVRDVAFEEELRALLHRAADPVVPDPGGWRRLTARIRRRRAATRVGGFALAGAAATVVAVSVVGTGDDARIQLGPDAGVATQAPVTEVPLPSLPPPPTAMPAVTPTQTAGALLVTDGISITTTSLDGTVLSTLVAGEGTSILSDLAVLPGGTAQDLTAVYRFVVDAADVDGARAGCGDLSWVGIQGGVAMTGGALPGVTGGADDGRCLGAPAFTDDGAELAWLTTTPDGAGTALEVVSWTPEGPVDGSLVTFDLDLPGLSDAELLAVELPPARAPGSGALVIRATASTGTAVWRVPIERQGDGALAVLGGGPSPVEVGGGIPGTPVDLAGSWRAVVLPMPDAEPRVGLAYVGAGDPLTSETVLTLEEGQLPAIDAIGDVVVVGVPGDTTVVYRREPMSDGTAIEELAQLAPVTSAVLLDAPAPSASAPPSPAAQVPDPVRDTAQALREAAQARSYDQLAALIPDSGFTSNYGGATDHIAFYRQEEANGIDVLGTLATLLERDPATRGDGIWVWPDDHLASEHLGYRVGIRADGTWISYVAGD
jgi:hypothetical protein